VSEQFEATGGDGSPLRFSAHGLPGGLRMDPATGRVTGLPTDDGVYSVSVEVADATAHHNQGFTWVVDS
jgi:hypothetical protein